MKKPITQTIALAALGAGLSGHVSTASAAGVWVDCQPSRVAVYDDRAHTRCAGDDTWFVVTLSQHTPEFVNRFIAITTSAIAANKPLKILYENTVGSTDSREVLSVEMFR